VLKYQDRPQNKCLKITFESSFISRISCWQTQDQVLDIYYYNTMKTQRTFLDEFFYAIKQQYEPLYEPLR